MRVIYLLGTFVVIYMVVNVLNNVKIYFVYSSGLGPLLLIAAIIVGIVVLYAKG